jgi:hypothetical protein
LRLAFAKLLENPRTHLVLRTIHREGFTPGLPIAEREGGNSYVRQLFNTDADGRQDSFFLEKDRNGNVDPFSFDDGRPGHIDYVFRDDKGDLNFILHSFLFLLAFSEPEPSPGGFILAIRMRF